MRTIFYHLQAGLLLALFLSTGAVAGTGDFFTLTLPAPALKQSLQAILPLSLARNDSTFSGNLILKSLDTLRIHNNIISVHGIVSGKNLAMQTQVAGQRLKLKLGQVTLPLTCDLHLRFDKKKQQLFFTPQFTRAKAASGSKGNVLLPLLTALGGHEYPVDLSRLQTFTPTIGNRKLDIRLQPVQVTTEKNRLILGLKPRKKKSR